MVVSREVVGAASKRERCVWNSSVRLRLGLRCVYDPGNREASGRI